MYTYTDVSVGFFSKAAELFKDYSNKMIFKVLDIEKSTPDQGYEPHSYDIIIASNVLHATASLQTTLQNVRQLLRPGGYLMLLEITDLGPIRYHSIVGSVPGWWLGVNDNRKYGPLLTPASWHSALRKAGFGGVDAHTPEIGGVAWPLSIIASQAVDDRVAFLRRPLSVKTPGMRIESLVILGNKTLETNRISEELAEHLGRFCGEIIILDGLPTEEEAFNLSPMSTFINLVDIDFPTFKDITIEKMDSLKRILELAKRILWVTQGAQLDQGYHTASVAFSRSIRQEAPHLNFSQIDVSDLKHDASKSIAEYLLQQSALDEWEAPPSTLADKQHRDFGLTWSKEPEVFLDRGKLKIPRLVENLEQNARLNSSRRLITKKIPIKTSNVAVISSSNGTATSVVEEVGPKRNEYANELVKVESSTLMSLRVLADTFLFLGIGQGTSEELRVFLSTTNSCKSAPVVSVKAPRAASAGANSDGLLVSIASDLLAKTLVRQLATESDLLVYCSSGDRCLTAALSRRAAAKNIRVTFFCEAEDGRSEASWLKVNSRTPSHIVRKLVRLTKPTHYLDLASSKLSSDVSLRITQALPYNTTCINSSTLFRQQSTSAPLPCDLEILLSCLEDAVSNAGPCPSQIEDLTNSLESIRTPGQRYATSTVQWPSDGLVEVEVTPLDAQSLFSKNKTYLLVGLSGQIGQSLCRWMVSNGAGCVCLTSRRPNVDKKWLESFDAAGATVKVFAADVLDKSSLESMVENIRKTCPPIAGVANGAMILEDQLFANMTVDTMRKVLGPKIDGSNNLDDIFFNDDLDFFVLFSSAAWVFGNVGQSNYSASNGYLNGLVRQRRSRGLAASAIDIGRVTGIGYIEAAGQAVQDQLNKLKLAPVSETDFRQTFAETILAGYAPQEGPEDLGEAVVTTGLRVVGDDEEVKGPWFSNAFFSHLVKESESSASSSENQDKKTTIPVAQQLSEATSKDEALDILQGKFIYDPQKTEVQC